MFGGFCKGGEGVQKLVGDLVVDMEAQQLIRGLRGLNIVGAGVVEVAPPLDPGYTTALVGATLKFELLCIMSDNLVSDKIYS